MKPLTVLTVLVLLASTISPLAAAEGGARLEGFVLGLDGQPAEGYRVHLIDELGNDRARGLVGESGGYEIQGLDAGRYALAIETPDGRFASVGAAPLRVQAGHLVRRDLKLIGTDPAQPLNLATPSHGFGTWWAGLTGGARIWTIVAIVVVAGITAEALSSDEAAASPFTN